MFSQNDALYVRVVIAYRCTIAFTLFNSILLLLYYKHTYKLPCSACTKHTQSYNVAAAAAAAASKVCMLGWYTIHVLVVMIMILHNSSPFIKSHYYTRELLLL